MTGIKINTPLLMIAVGVAAVIGVKAFTDDPITVSQSHAAQVIPVSTGPDLESAERDAKVVDTADFTDHFEDYQGSWVRLKDHSLHCEQRRDRSRLCTNTDGTAAVAVFYDRMATLEANGWTSPREFGAGQLRIACQDPLFYFSGTVPTTNAGFVGVHVDTLYCAISH